MAGRVPAGEKITIGHGGRRFPGGAREVKGLVFGVVVVQNMAKP